MFQALIFYKLFLSLFLYYYSFPRVVSIGIHYCDSSEFCRRVVLDSLGGEKLRKLFMSRMHIDPIAMLLPCSNLEQLTIECCNFTLITAEEFVERVPMEVLADLGNRFLPKLKILTASNTCLG